MRRISIRKDTFFLGPILGFLLLGFPGTMPAQAPTPTTFVAQVSGSATPPDGTAQITITLASPLAVAQGSLSIDLDPLVFDSIAAITVFSADGDQTGVAKIQGRHADVEFASNSGGIGRLPELPVLVMTAPVLVAAKAGSSGAVQVQSKSVWRDLQGYRYNATFQSPGIPVSGGPSIRMVVPGGGVVPAGTQVEIDGQGFTQDTKLRLDGVSWSNLQFVSPQQLTFTLSGPADLTGKLLVASNPEGAQTRYYSFFIPSVIRQPSAIPDNVQPIFPQLSLSYFASGTQAMGFENPSASPADVVLTQAISPKSPPVTKTITVAPRGRYFAGQSEIPFFSSVTSAVPIRAIVLDGVGNDVGFAASIPNSVASGSLSVETGSLPPSVITKSIAFNLRPSDPDPAPALVTVQNAGTAPLHLATGTDDGNPWLSASFAADGRISVSVNHGGLAPGSHNGIVSVNAAGSPVHSAQLAVQLNINADPIVVASTSSLTVNPPFTATVNITSDSGTVPIAVHSPDDWLSVTSTSTTTPATLTVSLRDSSKAGALPSGSVVIEGPANSITLPVSVLGVGNSSPVTPLAVSFSAPVASTEVVSHLVSVAPTIQPFTFDIATDTNAPWLTAAITTGPGVPGLAVSANPAGLDAGTYRGTVTIHAGNTIGPQPGPIVVTVTLVIWTAPTPLISSPASLEISVPSKTTGSQGLTISSGSLPLRFSIASQSDGGWLSVFNPPDFDGAVFTPAGFQVFADATSLAPGTYHGQVTVTALGGTDDRAVVPVTLTVTPYIPPALTAVPPLVSAIVNAGSLLPGAIAPGEIVSLFGIFGPDATSDLHTGSDGKANTALLGNRVLFNGLAAPLTYVSPTQISAVVPYELDATTDATVEVDVSGTRSPALGVPVSNSAPGVFTQSGTGQGAALILNQDGSTNSESNPAVRGSTVQIFATGEGQTAPPGITGTITQSDLKSPVLAVKVRIGGADAKVVSASTVPDAVAGVFQVRAEVPAGAQAGAAPVVVSVGAASSQTTAVISIR